MTAKEMFEKLGYKQERKEVNSNGYGKDSWLYYHKGIHGQAIVFSLTNNTVWTCSYEDLEKDSVSGDIYGLFPEEIQAITQQMKELGWIE